MKSGEKVGKRRFLGFLIKDPEWWSGRDLPFGRPALSQLSQPGGGFSPLNSNLACYSLSLSYFGGNSFLLSSSLQSNFSATQRRKCKLNFSKFMCKNLETHSGLRPLFLKPTQSLLEFLTQTLNDSQGQSKSIQ